MLIGEIVESLIQTKDKIPYSKEKQAIEEACNILSKFDRLKSYESIMNCNCLKIKEENINEESE